MDRNHFQSRNLWNLTFSEFPFEREIPTVIFHFAIIFTRNFRIIFLQNVHIIFSRNFWIIFFEKFLHFLFRENFSLFCKTDWIKILRFSRANKLRKNAKCDFPSSLETLVLNNVELIHTSSTTSRICEQSSSWLWRTHSFSALINFLVDCKFSL